MCDLTFCWLGEFGVLEPAEGLLLGSHHKVALSHVQDGAHIPNLQDKTRYCTVMQLVSSVADLDPGSGAFLTDPWIRDG